MAFPAATRTFLSPFLQAVLFSFTFSSKNACPLSMDSQMEAPQDYTNSFELLSDSVGMESSPRVWISSKFPRS